MALVIFLWVSAIGSAFLESLPYTTTITYIIINLMNQDDLGIPILPLAWALSVGACVGGIGSIMGSSANLVSIGVSERYSPANPIKGIHFLKVRAALARGVWVLRAREAGAQGHLARLRSTAFRFCSCPSASPPATSKSCSP